MGNFKGLTIEITGDATQLESVLLSIKRTSRSVQSEIEAVGKAMKRSPALGTLESPMTETGVLGPAVFSTALYSLVILRTLP